MNRTFLTSFKILCLLSTVFLSGLAFEIQSVKAASETIYIRADGSIDPPTAPISTADNVTYIFTGNITSDADGIVIERNNITMDGAGYTLKGPGKLGSKGIYSHGTNNITIGNTNFRGFHTCIEFDSASYILISGNNVTPSVLSSSGVVFFNSSYSNISGNNMRECDYFAVIIWESSYGIVSGNNITGTGGIDLSYSSYNIISENNIGPNFFFGIELECSSDNIISRNNIRRSGGVGLFGSCSNTISSNIFDYNGNGVEVLYGSEDNVISENSISNSSSAALRFAKSSNNRVYHNNLVNNRMQAYVDPFYSGYQNVWDDGYPSGGNYWSDYNGSDLYSGPYQNETGYDWIGDSPYVIDQNNIDRYPLMHPFVPEMEEIRIAYRNLLLKYDELQEQIDLLNSTCKNLQESISNLISTFNSTRNNLQGQINSLNQTYISLNQSIINLQGQLDLVNMTFIASISNLQEQQKALSNQVNTIQNALYVLAALIVILIVAIVYVAIRKPKTETKTEKETEAQ